MDYVFKIFQFKKNKNFLNEIQISNNYFSFLFDFFSL